MKVILYAKEGHETGERLHNAIERLAPKAQVETYSTIETLLARLHQNPPNITVVVLLAADRKDLVELLSISNSLNDIRIILVLPDGDNEIVSLGHKLYPRFVSYMDSNFEDVAAVLNKMLATAYPKQLRSSRSFEATHS